MGLFPIPTPPGSPCAPPLPGRKVTVGEVLRYIACLNPIVPTPLITPDMPPIIPHIPHIPDGSGPGAGGPPAKSPGDKVPGRTPAKGEPNSTQEFPDGKGGKTVREYGPDGRAVTDTDYGHDHGAKDHHFQEYD